MHPLCCIMLESPGIEEGSPEPTLLRTGSAVYSAAGGSEANVGGSDVTSTSTSVAGILYKWTNYGKGWRSRWFTLRDNGVLSYSKSRRTESPPGTDIVLIGSSSRSPARKRGKTVGIVHLKISSFRESKSDDRRFYVFTATKTLHLRTNSKKERLAWMQALISTSSLFSQRPRNDSIPLLTRELSVSTERLKLRLLEEGIGEEVVKDCEQIVHSEFSGVKGQFELLFEERSNLLDTLRQLEAANVEGEASGINDGGFQLTRHGYKNLARRKYSGIDASSCSSLSWYTTDDTNLYLPVSLTPLKLELFREWSTTESSDDVEKQDLDEASDEEEVYFFDTNEYFSEPTPYSGSKDVDQMDGCMTSGNQTVNACKEDGNENLIDSSYLQVERRKKLPDPVEKEKGVSLWSMIKDNIGKDLTRVCLPVYFNEPISSLQKCFEDLEYSHLLDQAYEHGKAGNSLMRILKVTAFAVSGYASSEGRHCKPFNPLLGETYEADYPEKGVRFFSEKVSHHPTLIACHCEGKGWRFWCDTNLKSKFWGRSIQVDPVGILNLEFDDGETFQWSKVTTSIYNLILGNIYCDHHGTMHIQGNRQYSCKLKFKERSILERNPHQVHGFVEDSAGKKVAQVFGKWDDSMYFVNGEGTDFVKDRSEASLLWKRNKPPLNCTRYNLTSFAITLNELTPGLKEKLPPTDSRLRPDQRHLENGEFDKANAEKLRLETRQRMSRKLQEHGWKPRWFQRDRDGDGPFHYNGGYWEAREQGKWEGCPDIFSEISGDIINSSFQQS